jgi:TolB-like protein/cytochrome c-type biogenesis protein CcmH/NrfG
MPDSPLPTANRAVFLSYAHEDAAAVLRIAKALRTADVEVWFDQSELRGGDAWDANIREQVETCALFVPIISTHTQARREGYFRLEWNLADDRTHLMAGGTPFLLPVVIDDTKERGALVPKSFLGVQWSRLPGGETPSAFVQRVRGLLGATETSEPTASGSKAAPPMPSVAPRRRFPLWAAAVGVVVLGFAAYYALRPPARAVPKNGPKSIAVLPFANMSDEKDSGYFADGVHEDVLTNLAAIHELYVTSRTTALQYRDTKKTLRQVGEELGVAYVLEGSVRRDGKKLRITGQLIRAGTDGHVWAKKYDRELNNVFAIQAEIATSIADELRALILPQEKKFIERRPTSNQVAHDLYLKERALRNVSDLRSYDERLNLLKAAVDLDPNFAEAWAAFAEILPYGIRIGRFSVSEHGFAKNAVDTAVRLAPDLPEVILAQGRYAWQTDLDVPKAAELFERAASLFPNFSDAHVQLGRIYRTQGRFAAAVVSFGHAVRLDQGNNAAESSLRRLLLAGRRYGEARDYLRRRAEFDPANLRDRFELAAIPFLASGSTREVEQLFSGLTAEEAESTEARQMKANWAVRTGSFSEFMRQIEMPANGGKQSGASNRRGLAMAFFLAAQGDLSAARTALQGVDALRTSRDQQPDSPSRWAVLAQWEAGLGNKDEALRCARKAVDLAPEPLFLKAPFQSTLAGVLAWTADKDLAIAEYARLLRVPWSGLNVHEMKRHPAYAPLRGDPRFEALLNDPKNNAPLF